MAVLPQTRIAKDEDRADAAPAPASVHVFSGDEMGESDLQFAVTVQLVELLTDYLAAMGRPVKVGGNLPFFYRQGDLRAQVTPDVYVLDDESPGEQDIPAWRVWERGGKVPSLVVEVVSRAAVKDYTLDPKGMLARYEELGVPEVVRYDPSGHGARHARRLLSHFLRDEGGHLVEQALVRPDRLLSKRYGAWLLHVPPRRLRLGIGDPGELALWPTRKERIDLAERRAAQEAERATQEALRAEQEAARAEQEAERAAQEAERAARAEQELAALRAELAALRGK